MKKNKHQYVELSDAETRRLKNVCLIAHLWGIMLCEVPYVHPIRAIEVHKHVQGRWALQTSLQILYKHTYAWLLLNLQSQATSFAVLKHV